MLAVRSHDRYLCRHKYRPGDAYVVFAHGGAVFGAYVGCLTCGLATAVQAQDREHGPQEIEVDGRALVGLAPGFTCSACKTRQAVRAGTLEAA